MDLRKLLGLAPQAAPDQDTSTVRRIIAELDALDPAQARYLAAFAFTLSRVANADADVSPEETRAMEAAVRQWGGIPEAQCVLVVQIAKTQSALLGATEDFLATRQFKATSTPAQREELLHCLFAVSAADDSISSAEESVVRQIASELDLTDRDFLAARSRYRDKLAVLKNLPGGAA